MKKFLLLVILVLSPCLAMAQMLPDLTVTDLRLNEQCFIAATVKNNGPGELPARNFVQGIEPSIQFYAGGSPWGGRSLNQQELNALKLPGGTLVALSSRPIPTGPAATVVAAEIDSSGNMVAESNETNNRLQQTVTCATATLPVDLAIVGINFTSDCRSIVTVKNLSNNTVPVDKCYSIYLQRYLDGQYWGYETWPKVDPTGAACKPGGQVVFTDSADFKGTNNVSFRIVSGGSIVFQDNNTANNTLATSVPTVCRVARPPLKPGTAVIPSPINPPPMQPRFPR